MYEKVPFQSATLTGVPVADVTLMVGRLTLLTKRAGAMQVVTLVEELHLSRKGIVGDMVRIQTRSLKKGREVVVAFRIADGVQTENMDALPVAKRQ